MGERWPDGSCYIGEYSDKKHGEGTYSFLDGRRYIGQWKSGEMNGKGNMLWPSGAMYEGSYTNGVKNGIGVFTWPDGRVYRGEWNNGQQHGKGVAIDPSGIAKHGVWHHGELVEGNAETALPSSQISVTEGVETAQDSCSSVCGCVQREHEPLPKSTK